MRALFSQLGTALLATTIFFGATHRAEATYPVIDVANIHQNTISAIENRIQSYEAVQQTVALLEQIAQLYAIYENGLNMYKSIGNAVDSIRNFRLDSLTRSWTEDFNLENFDRTLNRWGIEPSEDGMLADMNESLFGVGSAGKTIEEASSDIRSVARKTPRSFSRDRFIKNVVKGANNGDDPTNEAVEVEGIGDFKVTETPDGVIDVKRVVTMSSGEVEVKTTEEDTAELMVAATDQSIAKTNLDIAAQLEINKYDDEKLQEWMINAQSDGDVDQTELLAQGNLMAAMQNKKLGEMMNMNAAIASQKMQTDRTQIELMQAIQARENAATNVKAALADY